MRAGYARGGEGHAYKTTNTRITAATTANPPNDQHPIKAHHSNHKNHSSDNTPTKQPPSPRRNNLISHKHSPSTARRERVGVRAPGAARGLPTKQPTHASPQQHPHPLRSSPLPRTFPLPFQGEIERGSWVRPRGGAGPHANQTTARPPNNQHPIKAHHSNHKNHSSDNTPTKPPHPHPPTPKSYPSCPSMQIPIHT